MVSVFRWRSEWFCLFTPALLIDTLSVNAIIFLAPISCFDEKLAEDRRVNRLEDSYLLWRSVVACKLLSKTQVILFLNKCDLLESKLKRGIRIRENVPTYGERKNDLPTAIKCMLSTNLEVLIHWFLCVDFEQHFKEISKQFSPVARPFYCYTTSVVVSILRPTSGRLFTKLAHRIPQQRLLLSPQVRVLIDSRARSFLYDGC